MNNAVRHSMIWGTVLVVFIASVYFSTKDSATAQINSDAKIKSECIAKGGSVYLTYRGINCIMPGTSFIGG